MGPWHRELDVAADLALCAGRVVLAYHRTGVAVERKQGSEPVTIADRAASDLIVAGLSRAFPGDVVVSEEVPRISEAFPAGARVWLVDPLDGTRDFIAGDPGFAVMIGLALEGRPVLGAVYQPVSDRLFLGAPGLGARLRDPGGERLLRCSSRARLEELRLVASRSRYGRRVERIRLALGISDVLQVGSVGVKVGLIALGERDLYVNPARDTKAWDTCAPEAILREAGGALSDLAGGKLRYEGTDLVHRSGILASNGATHAAVVAAIARMPP